MTSLILLSTSACHLCEDAKALLTSLNIGGNTKLTEIDIVSDEALVIQYGERIPVLKHVQKGCELDWPFTEVELQTFLRD